MMQRLLFLSTLLTLSLMLAACQARDRDEPPRVVHTPLDIDPMDWPEIAGWWSNDEQLLRIERDRQYRLFSTLNRFERPVERGRWTRPSYAYFWLETYGPTRQGMMRINIRSMDGEPALLMPNQPPFRKLPGPPTTVEEMFLGTWESATSTLALDDSLRYTWSIKPEAPLPADEFLTGHRGRWFVRDDAIVLRPDPAGLEQVEVGIVLEDQKPPALLMDRMRLERK